MKTRLIATVIFTFVFFVSMAALTLFAPGAMAPTTAAQIPDMGGPMASPDQVDWYKTIDGIEWKPDIFVTVETSDTIVIEDRAIAVRFPFEIEEEWDFTRLELVDWEVLPNVGQVEVGKGYLIWKVGAGEASNGATLTKWFHVEPCDWTETDLIERLWSGGQLLEQRPVHFEKLPPDLTIDSFFDVEVQAGAEASFRLEYLNEGGYENDVMIGNDFPPEAPFLRSEPPADFVSEDGLRAEWDVGDLAAGDDGFFDVFVTIDASLPPSTTIDIWDYIYNHLGEPVDEVVTTFHVDQPPEWYKTINDVPWKPDIRVTVETSDTITIVDTVIGGGGFKIEEEWDPARLKLLDQESNVGVVWVDTGGLMTWVVEEGEAPPDGATLTKNGSTSSPATWTETDLIERLVGRRRNDG